MLGKNLFVEGQERSLKLNRELAWILAFVAGAVNAGGFLVVLSYTSHVTGNVSKIADAWALGNFSAAWAPLAAVACFGLGAFFSGSLVHFGSRARFRAYYAFSLCVEASLLMLFGFFGSRLQANQSSLLPSTVMLLSFIMGMHNAVITKISNAAVRTTHMTGIVTDLGLELSRLFYLNRSSSARIAPIIANREHLKLHSLILASFLSGGVLGALGFRSYGFISTLPLALILIALSVRPLLYDARVRQRLYRLGQARRPE